MKESNNLAGNVINNFLIWFNIKGQYMRESNILAENATMKLPQRQIWLNTKGEYMKESNILAGNVVNNFLIWFNIKGQYMRESNILAENATIKLPQRQIWLDTEEE